MTEHQHHEHVSSPLMYFGVFAALMVLTLATWLVAQVDLGWANDVVALMIAVTKALLVILFFMHVRYSGRLIALTVGSGILFLLILLALALADYLTRGWVALGR